MKREIYGSEKDILYRKNMASDLNGLIGKDFVMIFQVVMLMKKLDGIIIVWDHHI